MEITREALEKRLTLMRSELDQLRANLNATEGAIQDCQHWLEVLDKPEVKESK